MIIQVPRKVFPILKSTNRYQVLHGGRGGAKSHTYAKKAIIETAFQPLRFLCTREMQNSIKDSVHKLLVDQIWELGLQRYFKIFDNSITSTAGAEFIFRGLHHHIKEIKSMEGIDRVWCEEAETMTRNSWDILDPTIRKPGSQIWISFNPESETSPVYQDFVINKLPDSMVIEINYGDNPWFPESLRRQMEYCKKNDPEKYEWVWAGKPKMYGDAIIFKNKIRVESFEAPSDAEFKFGADFGYAQDPTSLIRMFILGRTLYIDYEAYGIGIEIDELHGLFDSVPESHRWTIVADSARPETISHLSRPTADGLHDGFAIEGAIKGKGSVEDGIQFLRGFEAIVIHPRCKGTIEDFQNYRWKKDRVTNEILPIPVDASNHSVDAARYGLESWMRGGASIFEIMEK